MIDTSEHDEIMEILENLEDESLATELLKEFNDCSRDLGQAILNRDESLPHDEWKKICDQLKSSLDLLIERIKSMG